jgi:hypothetical protein
MGEAMSTPTCPICGTKFPGDPCKKCEAPAGLEKGDVQSYKRMKLIDSGKSKKQVKIAMKARAATKTQKQRKHGRPV